MVAQPTYSIDSSSLIHAWRRAYRPRNFGFIWDRLERLAIEGRLVASIEVYNEIERKDDELLGWCKPRKGILFAEIDDPCQDHVARLMARYPRMVDTVKGRSSGDPFVIALAASRAPNLIVVTEEHDGKFRIPQVCAAEGIEHCKVADLIEREDWHFG